MLLNKLGLVTRLRQVTPAEIDQARRYILCKSHLVDPTDGPVSEDFKAMSVEHPNWTLDETKAHAAAEPGRCLLALRGSIVDVTAYLKDHVRTPSASLRASGRIVRAPCTNRRSSALLQPGGAKLLRRYSIRAGAYPNEKSDPNAKGNTGEVDEWERATWAFDEGFNRHSLAAVRRMETFVVARLVDEKGGQSCSSSP